MKARPRPPGSQTKTGRVHQALRQAIIEQQLAPGERLPEDAIGDSFGTSRTIAREALGRLAVEGLVDLIPNRGAFVANPSLAEARDIFAVRKGLERMVVLHLATLPAHETSDALRNILLASDLGKAGTKAEAIRLAGEFHLLLAELTGNELLARYVTEVVSRCSLVLAMYGRPHSADCGTNEHADIVEALLAQQGERAAALMDGHLDGVAGRALLEKPRQVDVRTILAAYATATDAG